MPVSRATAPGALPDPKSVHENSGSTDSLEHPDDELNSTAQELTSDEPPTLDWMHASSSPFRSIALMVMGVVAGIGIALGVAGWIFRAQDASVDSSFRASANPSEERVTVAESLSRVEPTPASTTTVDAELEQPFELLSELPVNRDEVGESMDGVASGPGVDGSEFATSDSDVTASVPGEPSSGDEQSLNGSASELPRVQQEGQLPHKTAEENSLKDLRGAEDEIASFARWLQHADVSSASTARNAASEPLASQPIVAPWQPALPAVQPTRSPPSPVNVKARLDDNVSGLQFKQVPLHLALRTLTQLTTIPIWLDPLVLGRLNVSPNAEVNLLVKDRTTAQTLDDLLQPFGLAWYDSGTGQIVISTPQERDGRTVTVRYDIRDLCGGDPQRAAVLANWVPRLVEYGTWEGQVEQASDSSLVLGKVVADNGVLVVDHFDHVQCRVLNLFERLRDARQLPRKSPISNDRLQLSPPGVDLQLVQEPVSLRVWQDRVIAEIAAQFERQAEVVILIDWPALHAAGWSPQDGMKYFCSELPLRDALEAWLHPLGLGVRVWDARTLEITSQDSLLRDHEIRFFSLAPRELTEAQVTQVGERILQRLGTLRMQPEGDGAIVYDAISNCLIASLAPLELAEVAALLAE
jgi:hypothetical protein